MITRSKAKLTSTLELLGFHNHFRLVTGRAEIQLVTEGQGQAKIKYLYLTWARHKTLNWFQIKSSLGFDYGPQTSDLPLN